MINSFPLLWILLMIVIGVFLGVVSGVCRMSTVIATLAEIRRCELSSASPSKPENGRA
jgi:ribose/xylose/arabinose/galactoside ABC-type transport system permease subunit